MKVLYDVTILGRGHITPFERAGIFRVIESLAQELALQPGCDLTLCTNAFWDDIELVKNYLGSNQQLSRIPFSEPVNYTKRKELTRQQEALVNDHNGDWHHLPFFKRTAVRLKNKELQAWLKILARPKKNQLIHPRILKNTDIYHSHFYASFNGIKEAGVKTLFFTSYDIIPILYPQYCSDGTPELMLSILDKVTPETWVVCISEATRNDLLNYMGNRLNPDKVKVTELAASNMFYQSTDRLANQQIRNKYNIPDAPYVLSLCTLEPRKNIDQAIRAFIKLVQQEAIPDLNLVLVGAKGWKFEKIFDAIEATAAIKKRILITGYLADEDLAALYSDALMFVFPSFYEGFGLPPLEAMQCGIPVITSDTSSLPEVVGDAGLMVSPTDMDGLCQAMLSVYKSPLLQQQLSQKSLARAKLFSWKRCAEKTMHAYKTSLLA